MQPAVPQLLLCLHQQRTECPLGVGMVAAVLPEQDLAVLVKDHQFHSCRADIDTGTIGFHFFSLLP